MLFGGEMRGHSDSWSDIIVLEELRHYHRKIGIPNVFIRLHEGGVVSHKTAQLVSVTAIIDSLGNIGPMALSLQGLRA
jgi:hypothetical protein